jgi:hypothetical protein
MIVSLCGYYIVHASGPTKLWASLIPAVREIVFITCWTIASAALPTAVAETITLVPSKDNTIIQWSPATPESNPLLSNGLGDIFVGRTGQDGPEPAATSIRRGLVRFDVAESVPTGAQITAATLTMRDVRGLNGDPTVRLHRVLQDWGEGTSFFQGGQGTAATNGDVTWLHTFYNSADPEASRRWDVEGGDFDLMPSAESLMVGDAGEGRLFSWSSPKMAADLQSWLNDPVENFGWMLLGDELQSQSAIRFNSRESTDPPNMPPTLTIEYKRVFPGDYNDDRTVNAADYVVWRKHLGEFTTLMNESATLGRVTEEDYEVWRAHFGAVSTSSDSQSLVPEPHCILLSASCYIFILMRFRGNPIA